MAIGQKVLVVSKKEPALRVLKEQLPARLQGLVISLLMQERAGSKQLEKAVEELQNIATQKTPKQLQDEATTLKNHAAALRQKVKSTEETLAKIATAHLSGFGPEKQKPAELARKLLESAKTFSWFTDRPSHLNQELSFGQNEVEALRKSLKRASSRIGYLDKDLPFINQVAATDDMVKCHRSLCRIQELSRKADDLPKIKVSKEWQEGYAVTPQVGAEGFRIDFVVESADGKRLAIECDGDTYHGPEAWRADLRRQRILERVGWKFWRCWASSFYLYRDEVLADLKETLDTHHIYPREDGFTGYRFTETRIIEQPETNQDAIIDELLGTGTPIISLGGILEEAALKPDAAVVKVGTRITVQYTDDKRNKEYLFQHNNPENLPNIITPDSPLGRALLDAGEEEAEFEFQLPKEHKARRGIILKVESLAS